MLAKEVLINMSKSIQNIIQWNTVNKNTASPKNPGKITTMTEGFFTFESNCKR